MRTMRGGLLAAVLAFLGSHVQGEEPARVGFEENFDTADGWTVSDGAPIKAQTAKDGAVRFETVCGALNARMKRADWPDWPEKPFESNTTVKKTYGKQIDLDRYRYLVVKLDERGTAVTLAVCGSWTPVCYTTGLRAFDLRHRGIGEKRDLSLSIQFLNTSGAATFDYVRLVSELTEDEKKVLMPAPVEYFEEKRAAHPYHKLEALNARAGRSRLKEAEGQLAVYRDTLSNGTVWKLTAQPGDQAFMSNDKALGWTSDGRYFRTIGGVDGRHVFDHAAGAWRKTAGGDAGKPLPEYNGSWESNAKPGVVYGYRTQWKRPQCDFLFFRFDQATGEETEIARITTDGKWDVRELSRAEKSNRAVLGLRGTPNVWIIDPDAADPAARAKAIVLKTRLKGVGFAKEDTVLQWHNCYTYEHWEMNIETGETHLGYYTGGGHAGGGFGKTLRHYEGLTTIQPSGLTDWKAGDAVKIFAYFKRPIESDYGSLVDGGRWWLVNGTGGDVANQHLLIDGEDCATILRLCGYNSSRNDWSTNTYTTCSPDATKVAWVSDQLGDGDVYYVVARTPDPPKALKAEKDDKGVKLTWQEPKRCKETAGYCVYGAGKDYVFRPLQKELVKDTSWSGKPPEDVTRFLVAAREWSGLESSTSNEARTEKEGPAPLHYLFADELKRKGSTALVVFDGTAMGFRALKNNLDKPVRFNFNEPLAIFLHLKTAAPGGAWAWKQIENDADKDNLSLQPGALLDVVAFGDPLSPPKIDDDRFPPPEPVKDAKAEVSAAGVVKLSWAPSPALNFSHVEIFASADKDFLCDNTAQLGAVLASQPQTFLDWDQKPGEEVFYKLVAVDTRGHRSEPVTVPVKLPVEKTWIVQLGPNVMESKDEIEAVKRLEHKMRAPKAAAEKEKPEAGDWKTLTLPFEVPALGRYHIWVEYAPGFTSRLDVKASVDGEAPGNWRLRSPFRPMSGTLSRPEPGKEKVFCDRLVSGEKDSFKLAEGKHTLTLSLDASIPNGQVHALGQVWISNDPTFRPPGYNPRADFGK